LDTKGVFWWARARLSAAPSGGDGTRGTAGTPDLATSRFRFTFSNCTVNPCAADEAVCSSHTPNLGTADARWRSHIHMRTGTTTVNTTAPPAMQLQRAEE
jgi:hypothetical protein